MNEGGYGSHETTGKASIPMILTCAFLLMTFFFYAYERV